MQALVNQYLCPYKDINQQFHCPNLDLAVAMSTLATVSCEIWDFQTALLKMKLSGIRNHFDSNNNVQNKRQSYNLCCHGAGYAYSEFLGLLVIGTQPSANFAKFGVDKIYIRN
jgi:hypothetical protein